MKIDTSKIINGEAVYCKNESEVRLLLSEMAAELGYDETFEGVAKEYKYYTFYEETEDSYWNAYPDKESLPKNYSIIEFTDLIIPKQSNLAKALGVQEEQEFKYRADTFRVHNGTLQYRNYCSDWKEATIASDVCDMINNPEEIKPLPQWTEEEIKMAEKDSFRFKYVSKDSDRERKAAALWEYKPICKDENGNWIGNLPWREIPASDYPSLQPGECVALEDIK